MNYNKIKKGFGTNDEVSKITNRSKKTVKKWEKDDSAPFEIIRCLHAYVPTILLRLNNQIRELKKFQQENIPDGRSGNGKDDVEMVFVRNGKGGKL